MSLICQFPSILLFLLFDNQMFRQTNQACKIWQTSFGFAFYFWWARILKNKSSELSNSLRANAQKNQAKSPNCGHSSKPNPPSFSVYNKVLMSL